MRDRHGLLGAAVLCVVVLGCVDPAEECAALRETTCPAGQSNVEDALYCEDYYEGSCSSEWDAYVQCAQETPSCYDADAGTVSSNCETEKYDHGHCLCEVESEHGWSPWCDIYGD